MSVPQQPSVEAPADEMIAADSAEESATAVAPGAGEADEVDEVDDEPGSDGEDLLVREGDVAGDYLERLLDFHDVIAGVAGVHSESEGEEPNRRVVVLPDR